MDPIFCKITFEHLVDLLFEAERYIYYAAPGLFADFGETLLEARNNHPALDIQLIIDPTEDGFRKHYGESDAIQKLSENDITIKEWKGNRLGFVITDEQALFLFNQSRAIEKDTQGYNAVRMSRPTKMAIMMHGFGTEQLGENEFDNYADNFAREWESLSKIEKEISTEGKTKFTPEALDEDKFAEVTDNLEQNPPVSPDFKRLLNVYSTKVKFAEFSVKGIKIYNKTVSIPNDIVQLADDSLRDQIKTRLKLFNDKLILQIEKLIEPIEKEVDRIREEYLYPVSSRKKSVMKAEKQHEFKKKVEQLKERYKEVQNKIYPLLNDAIGDVRKRLVKEMSIILKENPTDDLKQYEDSDQLGMFANDKAKQSIRRVNIPSLQSLASSFKIEYRFFDPTYEDFSDEDFIQELYELDFISEKERANIVSESQAIGTQPKE
jgi:hypothetical protein